MTVQECIQYVESHLEIRPATDNGAYTSGRTIRPAGCVNHSVGCAQPSVDVFFNTMNKSSAGWGVNALLGDFHKGEGRIILALQWNGRPWGCGSGSKGSWNNTKVQWEICEPAGHTYAGGTMVGYDLCNTVSEHGTVTRGVCHVNEQGMLDRVVETFHLKPCDDGKIRDIQENGDGPVYAPETPVSMNFWGFTPWLFEKLDAYFKDFLRALPDGELKKECLLPSLIGELIDRGELSVSVLRSSARWFGMTYHEDKEMVQRELQKLHDAGVYPKTLRA